MSWCIHAVLVFNRDVMPWRVRDYGDEQMEGLWMLFDLVCEHAWARLNP
jgi:hypothetical protein